MDRPASSERTCAPAESDPAAQGCAVAGPVQLEAVKLEAVQLEAVQLETVQLEAMQLETGPLEAAPPRVHAPSESRRRPDRELDLACLLVGSPREVLARIVSGDPLDVREAVVAVLHAECVFLDADRVHLRALARIARAGLRFAAARTDLANWIRAEVAGAVEELLREAFDSRSADPGSAFVQFARPLGLDPEAVRRGCAVFNRLPRADRAAFFALVVRSVGLETLARETGEPPSVLGRRARRGLDAVLHANHPELPPAARATPVRPPEVASTVPTSSPARCADASATQAAFSVHCKPTQSNPTQSNPTRSNPIQGEVSR